MTQRCKVEWAEIIQLSREENPSPETVSKLAVAKHKFTLVLSADYQQAKLIPHWGSSEQAASTYYLQKVSHDIFGLIDHRSENGNFINIFDERIGPKNTDHTISLLSQHLGKVTTDFPWIKRVCIFLDNAGNTNKNRFLFLWGMKVVEQHKLDHIRFCFLVAGHTKFAPDCLFALIANAYNRADVFTAEELLGLCQQFSTATIESRSNIFDWRDALMKKYSELSGVRKLHDFHIVRTGDNTVAMKVRAKCHVGVPLDSPLHIVDSVQSALPVGCYADHPRPLPSEKMDHMRQMYSRYVPPDRWPTYLETSTPQPQAQPLASTDTSQQCSLPPAKRAKKCSTPSCDGSGHKNKKRWNEGHTTKAGCPRR